MRRLVTIRSPYNYDVDSMSEGTGLICEDKTRTQQSFKDECDINVIMERFGKTGVLPPTSREPTFGDFTSAPDFTQAMNQIRAASEEFMALPANIRARFKNDPAEFIAFFEDDKNRSEAIELGFVPKPAAPTAPLEVRVVPDEGSPSTT